MYNINKGQAVYCISSKGIHTINENIHMLSRKNMCVIYVLSIVKLHVIDVTSPRSTYTERNCIVFLNAICFKYGTPNPWNGG